MLPRQQFIVTVILFIVGGAASLAAILLGAALCCPPTRSALPNPGGTPSLLGRLQQFIASQPKRQRFVASKSAGRLLAAGSGARRQMPPTVSSAQHLAFRETIVAQFFAKSFFARSPQASWEAAQALPSSGPWRGYELDRLKTRLLGEQFDETKNVALLADYRSVAVRSVASSYANFEDYFWAGHASLYAGETKSAAGYFEQARQQWPAHDTFYGYIYFFLICTDAIAGRSDQVSVKFEEFKQYFPDWLYVETYITELPELQRVYPKAALLWAVEGEIFALVNNDARALAAYRRALEVGGLDGATVGRVRRKIQRIEADL